MLSYIALTVIGLAALIIGIILMIRRKKAAGITLTVLGALAFLAGTLLTVCAFILVDFIHNQPVKEPPVAGSVTSETETAVDLPDEEPNDNNAGGDWRSWRSYSDEYIITDELTVCLSLFDDSTGYAVYDCSDGSRIASLVNDTEIAVDPWNITSEDIDGDGVNELGIVLTDGETLWYRYIEGEMWSESNTGGCFEQVDTDTISEDSLIEDFKKAQELWFRFEGGLENDYSDSVTGQIYGYDADFYRVTEPGIESIQDLKDYLSSRVDNEYVEEALSETEQYMEVDGVLYSCPAGRGDDLSIGWVEFSAENDGTNGKVTVTIHRQDFYDSLGEWYENGYVDSYEYPFTIVDGHAVFESMDYLCGSSPEESPRVGYDADSLETALLEVLEGTWMCEDGSNYYEILSDGSFTYYINDEARYSGYIVSSRSNDGSYMMEGDDFNGTVFTLDVDRDGIPAIFFDNGYTVFTKDGEG